MLVQAPRVPRVRAARRRIAPRRAPDAVRPAGSSARARSRFVAVQSVNALRDAEVARAFDIAEFGSGPERPLAAQIHAANALIGRLRRMQLGLANAVARVAARADADGSVGSLRALVERKGKAARAVRIVEAIWRYYFQLFGQRRTRFGPLLLAADRIALDCYQAIYTGLGRARSVPTPPPLAYMASERTPSTFRRGVRVRHLGLLPNPFPVVQLPVHRLVNPWTLGAVHHEVSHNLQSDLGLWDVVPRRLTAVLTAAGMPPEIVATWVRWHKEVWADLCGVLLGGPAIVRSLIDVVARERASTVRLGPADVHPSPFLRVLINTELLRRMGFGREAARLERLWRDLYAPPRPGEIPDVVLRTFPRASALVVEELCFRPFAELGDQSLAQTVRFKAEHEAMTREAAARLAAGADPGVIPARFLVGAIRIALERGLASPDVLAANFYRAVSTR